MKGWQRELLSCSMVIALSSEPGPWVNSDGTCDFSQSCIRVWVTREFSQSERARYGLPEFIEGYPVQYIDSSTSGGIDFSCKAENVERLLKVSFEPPQDWHDQSARYDPATLPKDPHERFDVLVGGISIGHGCGTAGTLGGFVWDAETDEVLGLTCAHIAAPPGAEVGDAIYQPSPSDIRDRLNREADERDICGRLLRWQEISFEKPNLIDAAVFTLTRPVWPDYILGHGMIQVKRAQ